MANRGKWLLALIAVTAAAALIRCDENTVTNTYGDGRFIMPLALGNMWSHEVVTTDSYSGDVWIDTCVQSVSGVTLIDNVRWYDLVSPCGKVGQKANLSDGLWTRLGPDEIYLIAKYPANVGDEWTRPGSSTRYLVASLDTKVSVPAGEFSCVVYRWSDEPNHYFGGSYYYSPGVGMIRSVYWLEGYSGVTTTVSSLIEYSVR
jgi:hypothetical protein